MAEHSPLPWELIEATENHGAYIVNSYGRDVCDLYAMSNPMAASMRNGGNSYPVPFTDADANAAFIVKAVNSYQAMQDILIDVWFYFSDSDDPKFRQMADAARALIPDPVGSVGERGK